MENQSAFTMNGKYTNPKIFAETIDNNTLGQILLMANEPAMEDSIIRLMPDVHYGKGATVGTTISFEKGMKKLVPDIVGVDIGCSISATKIQINHLCHSELQKLDEVIHKYVPSGEKQNGRPSNRINQSEVDRIISNSTLSSLKKNKEKNWIKLSVGTLGGGNHYIAIEKINDEFYLMIHTGSRRIGSLVAKGHQKIANQYHRSQSLHDSLPRLPYLEGKQMEDYLNDMHYAQLFARLNHEAIRNEILIRMGWEMEECIHSVHNYIDIENNTIRKGATDATAGKKLIVPLNMRDGSLIAVGKGNEDWNFSAPHGAGRLLSRSQAKEALDIDTFKAGMEGIFSTSVNTSTLSESPEAYKPAEEIIRMTEDTMNILAHVKPVYNYKSS